MQLTVIYGAQELLHETFYCIVLNFHPVCRFEVVLSVWLHIILITKIF